MKKSKYQQKKNKYIIIVIYYLFSPLGLTDSLFYNNITNWKHKIFFTEQIFALLYS